MTDQNPRPVQVPPADEERVGAAWIQEMHDHFRQRGFFRAEDLQRVLGDPRDHVDVQATDEESANFLGRGFSDDEPIEAA
jgi:hypothetical protein